MTETATVTIDEDDDIPPYLDIADIVRVSERSETVVRKHLKKLGIGEKLGNKLVVSRLQLRREWPTVHEHLVTAALEGRLQRPERPLPPRRTKKTG